MECISADVLRISNPDFTNGVVKMKNSTARSIREDEYEAYSALLANKTKS